MCASGRTSAAACVGGAGASPLHRATGEDAKEAVEVVEAPDLRCPGSPLSRGAHPSPEEAEAGDCGVAAPVWRRRRRAATGGGGGSQERER
jgi:hypothetical protein